MIWIALVVLVLLFAVMGRVRNRRRGVGEAGDGPGRLHHGHHGGPGGSSGHHGGGSSSGGHHG
ncbi:MAG TPA: hypothetical protein VHW06_13790 [Streptosporangiaceae bacterium]|nr:hypothetical protein [Streptosporangiaceae bacterium]